jgi:hypothetical protein
MVNPIQKENILIVSVVNLSIITGIKRKVKLMRVMMGVLTILDILIRSGLAVRVKILMVLLVLRKNMCLLSGLRKMLRNISLINH